MTAVRAMTSCSGRRRSPSRMPPLFQVMSVPVSTLTANEMAARVSMNTPALTPTTAAKAAKRDAKLAYLPCRLSQVSASYGQYERYTAVTRQ